MKIGESTSVKRCGTAVLVALGASPQGLGLAEAVSRLKRHGQNTLPHAKPPGVVRVFLHQITSLPTYVLVAAALVSRAIQEWSDAVFICAVLLVNAIIGTYLEHSAQRAAEALHKLVTTSSRVLRDPDAFEVNAEGLVPGNIALLKSGDTFC